MAELIREELVAICEAAIVPETDWYDRDSAMAHRQVGECWAQLSAGCEFEVHGSKRAGTRDDDMYTTRNTIWLTVWAEGFQFHESHEPDDPPRLCKDENTYYLPTRKRLKAAGGKDWY